MSFYTTLEAKLVTSPDLQAQAAANGKEQFSNSPTVPDELKRVIMDAMVAHQTMSTQALGSEDIRSRLQSVLLGPGGLWGLLRAQNGQGGASASP